MLPEPTYPPIGSWREPANGWIATADRRPADQVAFRLLCFPWAGGGASGYRRCFRGLPSWIEVWPVQLPGREARLREEAYEDLGQLTEALVESVGPSLSDLPFAIFGHSMGALIGYELARALADDGQTSMPRCLIVSSARPPQLPPRARVAELSDQDLADWVDDLGGSSALFADEELLALFLPIIRSDLMLCDTYSFTGGEPLHCPISVFRGREDPAVSRREAEAWRELTVADCSMHEFDGGHFFLQEAEAEPVAAIVAAVLPYVRSEARETLPERDPPPLDRS